MKISKKLSIKYGISVRSAKDYIHNGLVSLNGVSVRKDTDSGETGFLLNLPEKEIIDPAPYILADFGDVVFFDKPAFMHSERHRINDETTVQDIAECFRNDLMLISRLDYMTDGVIAAVRRGTVVKTQSKVYLAYVYGDFSREIIMDNIIDADSRKKVRVLPEKGGNRTVFTPLCSENGLTLVQAEIEKAARHQLRAYLSYLGYPIVGDTLYGGKKYRRIMLRCQKTCVNGFCIESKLAFGFSS